jgi:hypothetical protein
MKPSLVSAALAAALAACGAAPEKGDGATDVGRDVPAAELPSDGEGEARSASDARDDEAGKSGLPLPVGVAPARLLLDARATLTGEGRYACSHQEPASGDSERWCAFRRPHDGGGTELWIIDVTAAAKGAVPPCDGSSPACVRLTTTLWAPYGNNFEGDTLIFYSDAPAGLAPSAPFVGPVSAWRPGWASAHVLAAQATVCNGHLAAPVAVCLDEPRGDPNNPTDVRLRVGLLADVPDASLPALPGRWPFHSDGTVPWQLGFSPDGETFAVSVPDVTPFVQNLSVIPTRQVATGALRKSVIADLKLWTISNDGQKIFFYRGPRTDATLIMADFPAGTGETTLASQVVEFLPLGHAATDAALLLRVQLPVGGHAFQLLRDRERPETAVTVFSNDGFLEGVLVSPDLRYTAWIDPEFRGTVVHVDDLATCALNPTPAPAVSELGFLDDASLLFWTEPDDGGQARRDGFLAPPERCGEHVRFAVGVGFVTPVASRGVIFGDERDDTARTVTLKYAGLAHGLEEAMGGGVRVHERAFAPVTLVSGATAPDSLHVVYRAEADGARPAGVYLFGPVPF